MAPDFTATASLGGKEFTFKLNEALKKGPAVVYFYPSAYTGGCDLEAHTFAESHEKFAAAGASIIGVSADNLERLNQFAADPNFCAGKFPIASDESLNIAKSYNLKTTEAKAGAKDVRGVEIGHGFIERVTYRGRQGSQDHGRDVVHGRQADARPACRQVAGDRSKTRF